MATASWQIKQIDVFRLSSIAEHNRRDISSPVFFFRKLHRVCFHTTNRISAFNYFVISGIYYGIVQVNVGNEWLILSFRFLEVVGCVLGFHSACIIGIISRGVEVKNIMHKEVCCMCSSYNTNGVSLKGDHSK
jgi:hypothetical protein